MKTKKYRDEILPLKFKILSHSLWLTFALIIINNLILDITFYATYLNQSTLLIVIPIMYYYSMLSFHGVYIIRPYKRYKSPYGFYLICSGFVIILIFIINIFETNTGEIKNILLTNECFPLIIGIFLIYLGILRQKFAKFK